MENSFLPLSINFKNKNVLIIGAGNIAYRKAKTLSYLQANIKIITKEIACKDIEKIKNIKIEIRDFNEKDLDNIFLVIAATNDKKLNYKIFEMADKKNILVNNITSKVDMTARFMSTINNKDYQIGISAYGNPKKSKNLKEKIIDFLK